MAAQQTSELRGSISGPDGQPVAGVHVEVAGTRISARTDAHGVYALRGIPSGSQRIDIEHLGYRIVQQELYFRAGRPQTLDVTLEVQPVPGDTLEAAVRRTVSPQLRSFYARMDRGVGYFFTRDDIQRMQVRQFTDVLRRVPGLTMQPVAGPFGTTYMVQMGRKTGVAVCPVLFYLNGMPFPMTPDVGIDTFVRPDEVAGVEVYSGFSSTPPQYAGGHPDSRCGVILIWTHSGRRGDG